LNTTPLQLSPGVEDFIEMLIQHHVDVYLVSGGFRIMIEPIARQLGIPKNHIYANTLYFDETTGLYLGFDDMEPTSHDYGKRHALEQIQQLHNYQTIIMIGDGAMDAQAKPPASAFIGYGGVVVRVLCWVRIGLLQLH
jgi:phosphoserine phosphatase